MEKLQTQGLYPAFLGACFVYGRLLLRACVCLHTLGRTVFVTAELEAVSNIIGVQSTPGTAAATISEFTGEISNSIWKSGSSRLVGTI